MKQTFETALAAVLHHEGGFVWHKDDPGGATNLGCTKSVWEEWCGHPVEVEAIKALTPEDVAPLYKKKYWDKIKGDDLPSGVDYVVFDAAINSGVGRASKWLQEVCGTQPDGVIGPMTVQMATSMVPLDVVNLYSAKRLAFLKELKTWETFGKGWERRVNEVQATATKMVQG